MIVTTGLTASTFFVGRPVVEAQILRVDAPRSCRSSENWLLGRKQRSSDPRDPTLYCGQVRSTVGSFRLPDSRLFVVFTPSREPLFDEIAEGCFYELTVAGFGPALESGMKTTNRPQKTLLGLRLLEPCA